MGESFPEGIPTAVQAVGLGLIVQIAGVLPFSLLVSANLSHGTSVPWASAVELAFLWLLFRYLRGWGRPESTAAVRRRLVRTNRFDIRLLWPATAATCLVGVSLSLLIVLAYMLVRFPPGAGDTFLAIAAAPSVTGVSLLVTLAVMTGIVEEGAFRGYMQVPLEERFGPVVAVVVVAIAFAIAHFPPPLVFPIFVVGAAGWSVLAWLLNSTIPGMIAHTLVDAIFLLWIWHDPGAFRTLQARSAIETGFDSTFAVVAIAAAASIGITVLGFVWLGQTRMRLDTRATSGPGASLPTHRSAGRL